MKEVSEDNGLEVVATALVLEDVTLADGERAVVTIADGLIASVDQAAEGRERTGRQYRPSQSGRHVTTMRLDGYLLLPSLVEPHAHLDKTLLGERVVNGTYDLPGAIAAMDRAYSSMTVSDTIARASRAVVVAIKRGCLAIRTHVDCNSRIGTRSVEALVELRDTLRGVIDVQVAALAGWPITGAAGADNRAALCRAVELGIDLVGGVPWLDENPLGAIAELVRVAEDAGCGLDLHMDETTDPAVANLRWFAERVAKSNIVGPVTASHCVSLGSQGEDTVCETARALADVNIGVVTLPQTNLYLQGRGRGTSTGVPRGLTPVRLLQQMGVRVAAGGDNMQDPFNPMGSGDPLEAAMLLVCAGHATPAEAFSAVSTDAELVLGRQPGAVRVGYAADLLAVRAADLTTALATRPHDRIVLSKGVVIASTSDESRLDDSLLGLLP